MSGKAVTDCIRLAGSSTDCSALRTLGVAAARMVDGERAWSHAGILYRTSKKEVRFFDLRSHHKLDDEPVKDVPSRTILAWVEPRISRERAMLVVARCKLVLKHHLKSNLPYGFRYSRTAFDENGILRLGNGEVGLTCSTIIDAVFTAERIPLLDPSTWPPADDNDKNSRRQFIKSIRGRNPEHASILEAELDAPRIRPEEVVAAAAIHPTVGTFENLLDGADVVTNKLGL